MQDKSQQSFGEQAARFSLYVPLFVFFIGAFSKAPGIPRSIAVSMVWLNIALIVAGLCLGIAALLSMRRFGRQRILVRAIIGVIANGLILLAVIAFWLTQLAVGPIRQQMPGTWVLEPTPAEIYQSATLKLESNGTFHLDCVKRDGSSLSLAGTWDISGGRAVELTTEQGAMGTPNRVRIGRVLSVNPKQLILRTDGGQDVFDRAP